MRGQIEQALSSLCDEYEKFITQVIAPHIREVSDAAVDAAVMYQYERNSSMTHPLRFLLTREH